MRAFVIRGFCRRARPCEHMHTLRSVDPLTTPCRVALKRGQRRCGDWQPICVSKCGKTEPRPRARRPSCTQVQLRVVRRCGYCDSCTRLRSCGLARPFKVLMDCWIVYSPVDSCARSVLRTFEKFKVLWTRVQVYRPVDFGEVYSPGDSRSRL
jgi:hypothetical protein